MLERLRGLVTRVDARFGVYAFGDAAEQIRSSFWNELCDFYLEAIKVAPLSEQRETAAVLVHALGTYLKLSHPYMPFVTEHLWGELVDGEKMLLHAAWPQANAAHTFGETAAVDAVGRLVASVRGVRAEQGLEPGAQIELAIEATTHRAVFEACGPIIARLVRAENIDWLVEGTEEPKDATLAVDPDFKAAVRLGEADRQAEKGRLEKQLQQTEKRLAGLEKQLANENFVTRAKPEAVENVRKNAEDARATLASVRERLASLS